MGPCATAQALRPGSCLPVPQYFLSLSSPGQPVLYSLESKAGSLFVGSEKNWAEPVLAAPPPHRLPLLPQLWFRSAWLPGVKELPLLCEA